MSRLITTLQLYLLLNEDKGEAALDESQQKMLVISRLKSVRDHLKGDRGVLGLTRKFFNDNLAALFHLSREALVHKQTKTLTYSFRIQVFLRTSILVQEANEVAWTKYVTGAMWKNDMRHIWGYEGSPAAQKALLRDFTLCLVNAIANSIQMGDDLKARILNTVFTAVASEMISAQHVTGNY
jgi:hypothetical protein